MKTKVSNNVANNYEFDLSSNGIIKVDEIVPISQMLTLYVVKKQIRYGGKPIYKLYTDLLHDILDVKPLCEPYSYGYDIAQEVVCILYGHIGENYGKIIGKNYHGKPITILDACYNKINLMLSRYKFGAKTFKSYEHITRDKEPVTQFDLNTDSLEESQKYVDNIIELMNLSQGQLDTLNCYMAGITFRKIAKILSISEVTVWRRRKQIQEKYLHIQNMIDN